MSGNAGGIADDLLPERYTSPLLVARGGMGEVYRATDSVLQRTVAVKLLADRHAREPEVRERFEREALAAARLSGARHVITVFDVGEHADRPFIVMEYLEGGSVQDRLRAGRVPREQALVWLEQAAEALDRAHAAGIVHRDVKPANLLLDDDGQLAVTDFGIASAAGLDTLTLPGTVLGTAGYLSPEQARGEAATPASDRYALGVLAFELLTGRRPFAADTSTTEAFAHVNAPPPPATSVDSALPSAVDRVFVQALAKEPGGRPTSCVELVSELRAALNRPTAAAAAAPAPTAIQPTRPAYRVSRARRHVSRKAVSLAALAAVASGFALAALLGANADAPSRTTLGADRERSQSRGTQATTQPRETTQTGETVNQRPDGASLNDAGYARMQRGDFAGALPLLERAVAALAGSGSLAEAYASYNLAFTRFALGRCDGVLELLDRSKDIQGERSEIDRLRREAERACEDGGEGRGRGKGNGNGNGHED